MSAPGLDAETTATEAAVTHALGRAAVYRLLGGVFAYPDAGFVAALPAAAEAAGSAAPASVRVALARLGETARPDVARTLAADYVAAFDRQAACPPYEGAYGPPQMAGKATQLADVAGFYTAFGLTPAATRPEIEYHIAAELEFMSVLALKEAAALAEGHAEHAAVTRDAQAAFLRDHLGRWGEAFAQALGEVATTPYYAAGAAALAAWLRVEAAAHAAAPMPAVRRPPDVEDERAFGCPLAGPCLEEEEA